MSKKPDLSPPWVTFGDGKRPTHILAAGRPGEVACVRALPAKTVRAIVNAANQPIRDAQVEIVAISTRIASALTALTRARSEALREAALITQGAREGCATGSPAWHELNELAKKFRDLAEKARGDET